MTATKRKLVPTEIMPIRWGDMDAMGHVNNTIYFRYMEQARISWFEAIGARSGVKGQGPVIVNASCTFIKQLVYPGDVEIKTYVGELGRSSLQTYLELRPSYDPQKIVVGTEPGAHCRRQRDCFRTRGDTRMGAPIQHLSRVLSMVGGSA